MKVILKDYASGEDYYLNINDSQRKLFNWLVGNSVLSDDYELIDITDDTWEDLDN